MQDRCPICGERKKSHIYGHDDGLLQAGNQARPMNPTIIDAWDTVLLPPAPKLQAVLITPENSALLILDMQATLCKTTRCLATVAKIKQLLTKARQSGMLVVYSLTKTGTIAEIMPDIFPSPDDPTVSSSVDKFYKTKLDRILRDNDIQTVLVTGFAANGAVLHTATAAAFRGYQVIVPVDGMSANTLYAEQYTAWHMLNSPGTRDRAILTKTSMIRLKFWP